MASTQAQCAAIIRKYLKEKGLKCSVTSKSASMMTACRVTVYELPPEQFKEIEEYCNRFQYGHFNGMEDIYEYSNSRDDIPQVKYMTVSNKFSDETYQRAWDFLRENFSTADEQPENYKDLSYHRIYEDYATTYVYRLLRGSMDDLSNRFWQPSPPAALEPSPVLEIGSTSDPVVLEIGSTRIEEHTHTTKGFQMFIVVMVERVDRDEYLHLLDRAKSLQGWYSRAYGTCPAGFAFKERSQAEEFVLEIASTSEPPVFADDTPVLENRLTSGPIVFADDTPVIDEFEIVEDEIGSSVNHIVLEINTPQHTFKRQSDGSFDIPVAEKPIIELSNPDLRPPAIRYRVDEYLKKQNRWEIGSVSYRDTDKHRNQLKRHLEENEKEGIETRVVDLLQINTPCVPKQSPVLEIASTSTADHLTEQADKLQPAIDAKLADRLTNTPKRMGQAAQARLEGFRLQRTQTVLRRLAVMHTAGTCPPDLAGIKTKKQVYDFMRAELTPVSNGYHSYHAETGNMSPCLASNPAAVKLWSLLGDDKPAPDPIKTAVEALQFNKIPGYFPTPSAVIDRMLDYADIEPEHKVLEPSAGSGNIADRLPGCDCIERHCSLANILRLKGHKVIGDDFLEMEPQPVYDRIIANPPFDRGLDIAHITRMRKWLAPGGRIVAIAAGGPRQVEQLQPIASHWETLPAGSFKESGTGVSSVLMVIDA